MHHEDIATMRGHTPAGQMSLHVLPPSASALGHDREAPGSKHGSFSGWK